MKSSFLSLSFSLSLSLTPIYLYLSIYLKVYTVEAWTFSMNMNRECLNRYVHKSVLFKKNRVLIIMLFRCCCFCWGCFCLSVVLGRKKWYACTIGQFVGNEDRFNEDSVYHLKTEASEISVTTGYDSGNWCQVSKSV